MPPRPVRSPARRASASARIEAPSLCRKTGQLTSLCQARILVQSICHPVLTDRSRFWSLVVYDMNARQRLLELSDVELCMTEVVYDVERLRRRTERGTPGARARWN